MTTTEPGLNFKAFDADNHYYEALDAFTRHLDPKSGPRTIQWCEIEGRKYHVVGGKVSRAVVNPTFNPIAAPGALHAYFRGNPEGKNPLEMLAAREQIRPEYRNRDARLEAMDRHGLEKIWLFPTLGVLYEELLKDDPEAVTMVFESFNRWLEDDWGCNYNDRIFAAPYISLARVDHAVAELERALAHDARVVCMRPAAVWTDDGPKSPADKMFDPFWSLVNDSGITVVAHASDSGYTSHGYATDGFSAAFGDGAFGPSIKMFNIERAAFDFFITLAFEQLFVRFPNVRMASVENGSGFLRDMFRKLGSTNKKMAGWFPEHPVNTFKEHVWINPFWEDDVHEIVELMGVDRVIFGSDWPHIEGMPEPLDYVEELDRFNEDERRKILRDNVSELNERRPT